MSNARELYDDRVRTMDPAERLFLARLILDDLAPSVRAVDVGEEWSDEDLADVTAFAVRNADREESKP